VDFVRDVDEPRVRPAGQRHRLVVEEQFDSATLRRAVVRQAQCAQISDPHVVARSGIESAQNRRVGDSLEM